MSKIESEAATRHVRGVALCWASLMPTASREELTAEQASQSINSLEERSEALVASSQVVESKLDKAKADQWKKKSEIADRKSVV